MIHLRNMYLHKTAFACDAAHICKYKDFRILNDMALCIPLPGVLHARLSDLCAQSVLGLDH